MIQPSASGLPLMVIFIGSAARSFSRLIVQSDILKFSKDFSFTVINDKEKPQNLTFKKPEPFLREK